MSEVLGVYYGTGNSVTTSGSYTLDPGGVLGLLSPAAMTVSSPDGEPVDATINFAGLLDLPVTAAASFTVTAEKNTVVTVSAGAVNALTTTTLDANGGTVALAGGLLNAASGVTINLTNGGTFNGSGIISALAGATINFGSGGGTLNLAGSDTGLALLSGASINNFGSGDSIIVESDGTPATVTGISYDGLLGASTLTFSNGDTLALQGQYQDTDPKAAGYVSTVADADGEGTVLVCFLAGSMIRTPDADIAVEDLCAGDTIIAMVNDAPQPRTITWAGRAHAMVRPELPDDEAGYPVRILKDAISAGVPYKDMLITAEHCLYFEGRFVPARMLVNNTSIFYDRTITSYDYYHIETQEHAVIIADGMLTESYLDTGNRRAFVQKDNVVLLGGSRNLTWAHAAAPLDVSPGFVEPLFRQIAARAAASGHEPQAQAATMTDEADLHLMTQTGAIIHKMREANGFAFFMIPPGVESVRIMSRTSRPSDTIGPYIDDRRQLGVLIKDIKLFEGSVARPITTHLAHEAPEGWHDGWYAPENVPCRWTDGQASMPLGTRHPTLMGLLCLEILAGGPYVISTAPQPQALTA